MHAPTRDVRITGVSKKGSSWQYHIEVLDIRGYERPPLTPHDGPQDDEDADSYRDLPPVVRYTVMRRYSDFRQLYLYLLDTHRADAALANLPNFPEGGLFSYLRGHDPKLLQYRKEQLQDFLRALDDHVDTKWCSALTHFLRPDLPELTTVAGSFQASVAQMEKSRQTETEPSPPPSSTSSYVSLSHLKSPEIRFHKQLPNDKRGDSKRRKLARVIAREQYAAETQNSSSRPCKRAPVAPANRRLPPPLERKRSASERLDEDEEEEENDDKSCTDLETLLALELPPEAKRHYNQ